jgi:hypothetical protein
MGNEDSWTTHKYLDCIEEGNSRRGLGPQARRKNAAKTNKKK